MSEFEPKTFWRISNRVDLSGKGGRLASARWHTIGKRIVYLADCPAGALIETLVHLDPDLEEMPDFYLLLQIPAPSGITIEEFALPEKPIWQQDQELTRRFGDAWLVGLKTPLARVPSAIVPHTWNYLLNPEHPDSAKLKIETVIRERFDNRLFRFGAG